MSFNNQGSTQLPLINFGGLVTEVPAPNVPEGSSPDNQDVVYRPNGVSSRPGMKKVFATPFGTATVTYSKSYVDNEGTIRNLYLDSLGNLYVENVTTNPGSYSLLTTTTAGSYAKSITAFGREYIAISDGLHGSDIPLQYDGINLDRYTQDGPGSPPSITSTVIAATTMAAGGPFSEYMVRNFTAGQNYVQVWTGSAHNLQVGYRVLISGVPAQGINFISSIVINNDDSPGIASVTLVGDHGLAPGERVIIALVAPTVVGTGISSVARAGQIVTVVTSAPHGLSSGAQVQLQGVGDASFNTVLTVASIVDASSFTCYQADTDATSTGGTVNLLFPESGDPTTPTYYEVVGCPTTTTFQVALNYVSGTWSGSGNCLFPWDGTFYVSEVVSSTSFKYLQYGPSLSNTTVAGTVTPFGQAAPGIHQVQVLFETRQGYVTAPSPPLTFTAQGGQYLTVSDIPTGPSNVVARILAFTGAGGSSFFYIPVPGLVNGQVVSTSTRVGDNTTTSVVLDFSDNTLYASLGINTFGNNLPGQIVIDGALGFGYYGSRIITNGQRNKINNLLNMGFDGGSKPSTPTIPTGWTPDGSGAGGALSTGHYGSGWLTSGSGFIYQSFYRDCYSAPIGTANTRYKARAWVKNSGGVATVTISSVTASFTATATLSGATATGAWVEASFSARMPTSIPADMVIKLSGTGGVLIDELSIIYFDTPYLDHLIYASYVNNPEAINGLTGKFGPAQDSRKVMDYGIIRNALYILTQDPSGRIHSVFDNGVTEPAGWTVNEVAGNCGLLSAFALTKSQADDTAAGGGEEWLAWASASGARIFGGDQPWKISQEIYPDWDSINTDAYLTIWALNDPTSRIIYFGLPFDAHTAPNRIYIMDYKELDGSYGIGMASPLRPTGGRSLSREPARKWSKWTLPMNGMALMYRNTSRLFPVFFSGNGSYPNTSTDAAYGNVYIGCSNKKTDDDFGLISPYYTTHFFSLPDIEIATGITSALHLVSYFQWLATGTGVLTVTPYIGDLTNPWPKVAQRNLRSTTNYDDEWVGGSIVGQRIAFKFASSPGSV